MVPSGGPRSRAAFPRGAAAEVVLAFGSGLVVVRTAHPSTSPGAEQAADWHSWLGLAAVLLMYHGLARAARWLRRPGRR